MNETQRSAESFGKGISVVAGIISGFITLVREAIGFLIEMANQAIRFINIINPGQDIGYIPNPSLTGGMLGQVPPPVGNSNSREGRNTVNNITIQALDSESAARAVAKVLNESASRSVPQLYNSGITRAR